MYSDFVMDHFRNPRNGGRLPEFNARGIAGDPSSGPFMIIYLKLEGAVVREASFETFGCPAAIAAGSVLTEYVKGKAASSARSVNARAVLDLLRGLPLGKEHCADIASTALSEALKCDGSFAGEGRLP